MLGETMEFHYFLILLMLALEIIWDLNGRMSEEMSEVPRENLGKIVREVWIEWAEQQPRAKDSWFTPWDELDEPYKEVDRRIGERLWQLGYLAGVMSEDALETDRLHHVEEVATKLFVQVWRSIQRGAIDERSMVSDVALVLRDALNPDWPSNPNWLPNELQ